MVRYLLVGAGGALGAMARYALDGFILRLASPFFPSGTFVVNVAGCLIFGLIMGLADQRSGLTPTGRLFLLIGLLGGFTTFSTYTFETFELVRDGQVRARTSQRGRPGGGRVRRAVGRVRRSPRPPVRFAMKIPTEGKLLRVFIGEADRWHGRPLYEAIVEEARARGLAGATVWKGTLGFGAHSRMHTAKILRLSEDLPVVIEIVDAAEKIEAFVRERLDEMVQEGLVTLERAEVIMYRGPDKPRG